MRSDPNTINFCAQQVVKIDNIETRRDMIKQLSIHYGGRQRVVFEEKLKAEVKRLWIGKKG